MRYAVIPKDKATEAGIALAGHYDFGDIIVVNERELMALNRMKADGLGEVAARLGGELLRQYQITDLIKQYEEEKENGESI